MNRHRVVFAAVGGLVVAGALLAGLLLLPGLRSHHVAAVSALPFTRAQQSRLVAGLTAPDLSAQAAVLATEIRSQFLHDRQPLLPAGSRVRIDAATFRATSSDSALVDAVVSGPRPGHWQLLLVGEDRRWLVIGTREPR